MMFGVDVKLVLFPLALIAALVEAEGSCCYSKKLNGKTYTLIESNSDEVATKGCDTANNCIYGEDGTSDRYCFKRGGQEVPDCLQAKPPCTDYFVMADLNKAAANQSITTGSLNPNCTAPSIPSPSDDGFKEGKLFQFGNDLVLLDNSYGGGRQHKVKKLEAGAWKETNFTSDDLSIFPTGGYSIASYNNVFYAVGGVNTKNSAMLDTVFKSVDGFTWKKLSWTIALKLSQMMSCITKNDRTGHANLVVTGGWDDDSDNFKKLQVYDLEAANPGDQADVETISTTYTTGETSQILCHDGWVHVAVKDKLYSRKLSGMVGRSFDETSYVDIAKGGKLIVHQDKIALVGGTDSTDIDVKKIIYFNGTDFTDGPTFPWFKEASATSPASGVTFISKQ